MSKLENLKWVPGFAFPTFVKTPTANKLRPNPRSKRFTGILLLQRAEARPSRRPQNRHTQAGAGASGVASVAMLQLRQPHQEISPSKLLGALRNSSVFVEFPVDNCTDTRGSKGSQVGI
jgi:hypothetical protein